jgi:hypothetical protein
MMMMMMKIFSFYLDCYFHLRRIHLQNAIFEHYYLIILVLLIASTQWIVLALWIHFVH